MNKNYKYFEYSNSRYPLYIGNCIFDAESFTDWIMQWLIEFNYKSTLEYLIIKELNLQFKRLHNRIIVQKQILEVVSNDKESYIMLQNFTNGVVKIYTRVQFILDECDKAIMKVINKSQYITNSTIVLYTRLCINTLLDEDKCLNDIKDILNKITIWIYRFDTNYVSDR